MTTKSSTLSLRDIIRSQQNNIREYGMYVAFVIIVIFFTITTKGLFVSSRNIGNLVNAISYIAVLAVGMTMVIVIRHIDLSVGFLAGTLGAVAAIALKYWHLSVFLTIPMVLVFGILAGLLTAFLVAQMKIPAFVATLAGWLGYHGILQLVTAGTGTIIIADKFYDALGSGYIPDIKQIDFIPGIHEVTLLVGLIAIAFYIYSEFRRRHITIAYHFEVQSMNLFIIKLVFASAIIAGITWILAGYQGLSWATVIVLFVVILYTYIATRTVTGRHIYAVGGNPEAAQLNGISVKKVTFLVFGSMGLLSALSGILYSSWLRSATTIAGTGWELDAIAAAFVGGVAVSGGVGKIPTSLLGALVMGSLTSGMNLLAWDNSIQYIVKALVLAGAVIFDVATRNKTS
jgi:putative multiple sugar transport system permease protein